MYRVVIESYFGQGSKIESDEIYTTANYFDAVKYAEKVKKEIDFGTVKIYEEVVRSVLREVEW